MSALLAAVLAAGAACGDLAAPLPSGETAGPTEEAPSPPRGLEAVRRLAERSAGALGARTGRSVPAPAVVAADAETIQGVLRGRWLEGYPWRSADERLLLGVLGLLDARVDLAAAAGALVASETGPLLDGERRLLVPEAIADAPLSGDDPLLEAVGLTSLELRIVGELARSSARRRLLAAAPAGSSDSRAARWALGEAYARLAVLDVLLRAGGVSSEDAGMGLLGLETAPAVPAPEATVLEGLAPSVRAHLVEGPRDALRLLVHRLLVGGWPAVEAALDAGVPGGAALDPAHSGEPPASSPAARLALGPRHLRLLLEARGVGEREAEALAAALDSDELARAPGREGFWTWRLVFRDSASVAILAAAWGAAPGPSITASGASAVLSLRAP